MLNHILLIQLKTLELYPYNAPSGRWCHPFEWHQSACSGWTGHPVALGRNFHFLSAVPEHQRHILTQLVSFLQASFPASLRFTAGYPPPQPGGLAVGHVTTSPSPPPLLPTTLPLSSCHQGNVTISTNVPWHLWPSSPHLWSRFSLPRFILSSPSAESPRSPHYRSIFWD